MKFSKNVFLSTIFVAILMIMMIFGNYCNDKLTVENNTSSEVKTNSITNSEMDTNLVVDKGSKNHKHTISNLSNEVKKSTGKDIYNNYMNTIYE